MNKDYLFFDIECFRYDWLVIFKDIDKNTVGKFHNDSTGLLELITEKTLIGFNNLWYDNHILTAILNGWSNHQIKDLNDRIIGGEKIRKIHQAIYSLDVFQQIDVSMPSLKKIEGNFGKSIIESDIDFNIDRELTTSEMEETVKYCEYDVLTTIDVWKLREYSYFEPKKMLIGLLNPVQRDKAPGWNTTTISANLLTSKPMPKWYDIRLGELDQDGDYEIMSLAPDDVKELWATKDKGKHTHKAIGCNIEFAFGGLHGVPVICKKKYNNVKLLDVASLYPNIILKLNALGMATETYRGIVEKRLSVKHIDKPLSDALKLVINSCYGLLNNQYSVLFNPKASKSVCLFGQLILYDLCQRLSPTCQLININTDGVAFITESNHYKEVWKEWEQDYNLVLEEEQYKTFIQKDVNNYIAIEPGGYIKCKGGDVGRYHGDAYFKNNNMRIVDIAVVDKLLYDKDILTTIQENLNNPKLFQIILKAGYTYQGTFDASGKQYQKVNRVFAVKKDGVLLQKKRIDGGLVRFADCPEQMIVWNGECDDFKEFRKKVDINFYYTLINKVLKRWM